MLINIYFPCSGTANRSIICENLLSDIEMWRDCKCVIAGDFNCDFDGSDAVSLMVQTFIHDGSFNRCDIFPEQKVATYVNEALRQQTVVLITCLLLLRALLIILSLWTQTSTFPTLSQIPADAASPST